MIHHIHGLLLLTLSSLGLSLRAPASPGAPLTGDKLKVVCTIQDLADITKEIGGDRVDVTTIARGKENLHLVQARPSHLIALSRADVFVQVGLSLETGFVPGLLEGARNPKIQPGKPGFITMSEGWNPIQVPTSLSRQAGDVHPQGNPHLNLDPRAGRHVAELVLAGLAAVDPGSKAEYEKRQAAYLERLGQAAARWAEMAKSWKGKKVVVYHMEYDYFTAAYGIETIGKIEIKPGIPPTPNHVAELIDTMRREKADAILTAIWSNNSNVAQIAEETHVKVVELPNQCGGLPGTETWIGMMDLVHQRLADAFGVAATAR
ncbi:MAG TPA: metal ABC transporter substrate-binding protein [Planctomycetota bacterium]|jgi:ABC-type Zn uptake system ZnuABC Zn-binding protein ZnuA|nr:metal ABC transporter substrate-binding protein [Planctomycetota bacterium]